MISKINYDDRPDPEAILQSIKKQEEYNNIGKLKIFFGMSAGVGKTYAMLKDAKERLEEGIDVVIGIVNTHGRKETIELTKDIPVIPEKTIIYKGSSFQELDIDEVLKKRPQLVLVDELAHTNVPGSRHHKRWQDVVEILDAGIDVYTALNVQHIESRKDVVEEITGILIRETVPDSILERANQIELIDITPHELLKRLKEGKVYLGPQSEIAAKNFFQIDRLTALREIALRMTAEKVEHDLHGLLPGSDTTVRWKSSEKLMVAVSHSPHSQTLIRTCRRYAFTFDAPWIAVHVDNGKKLSQKDNEQLTKNLSLASELGAEIVSIVDVDVGIAIQKIAKQKHVTQIIVGRPEKRFFRTFFGTTSLIDNLKYEHSDIDIHIIRKDPSIPGFKTKFFELSSPTKDYWYASLYILAVAGICDLFFSSLSHLTIGFIFLIAVIFLSMFVTSGPILLTAILASIIWGFSFVPGDIVIGEVEVGIILSFFAVSLVFGRLSKKVKDRETLLRFREGKTQALYEIVREIAKAPSLGDLFKAISLKLDDLLDGKSEIISKANNKLFFNNDSEIILDEKEKAVATWVLENEKKAGFSTETLSSSNNLYIPLKGYIEAVGVLAFRPTSISLIQQEDINLLQTVCQQLAVYVERIHSQEKERRTEYIEQVEKIQRSILNSISLEFHNPLYSIQGAASALKDPMVTQNAKLHNRKVLQIEESSQNLSRIIDNVLAMSKLSSGFFNINKSKNDINELITACLSNTKNALEKHIININVQKDLPKVNFDFTLMELLLCNLLMNSVEYTKPGSKIDLEAVLLNNNIVLSLKDEGYGIPKELSDRTSDKFYRLPEIDISGASLGLSLIKKIADLHEAKVEFKNTREGGLDFKLYLPL